MNIRNLENKKIALLGLGVENYALAKFLMAKKVKCQITVCDSRDIKALGDKFVALNKYDNVFWQLKKDFNKNLDRYDVVFRSPGWPLACPGIGCGIKNNKSLLVYSPMKLFFDLCPTKNIIGITGTKGKGTTSSLIYHILKTAKKKVFLGGNIGTAPFDFIKNIKPKDWVVLELSSFQLEDLHISPQIAVFTNFTKEHLAPADPNNPNFHKTLKAYQEAKLNIARWQKKNDYFILNSKFKDSIKSLGAGKKIFFSKSNLDTPLVGEHNKENIAAAEAVAKIIGIDKKTVAKAVKNFTGLDHRIEFVREKNGVKYFDDSFATTPESAIIALKSFNEPIILLAGGADKGADFKQFAKEISKRTVFVCLLDGKATPRIKKELDKLKFKNYKIFNNFEAAITAAKDKAKPKQIILLSTACASFGMFANYKERGNLFKTIVKKL